MKRSLVLGSTLAAAMHLLGCSEDVGTCEDRNEGRDTVLVGSSVQYAGQAIMNQSCANNGCHSSTAKGPARSGAPANLDFDLRPAKAGDESENGDGDVVAEISEKELEGLRKRQHRVVDLRNDIWDQVKKDLMPPDGMFAPLRELKRVFTTDEADDVCTGKDMFSPITDSETKEVLRNWLACGAPIVETNTELVQARTPGTVGYQYPMCEATAEGNTLAAVQTRIFDEYCAGCHPGTNDLDLSSVAASYAALVDDDGDACNGKPFVTKGDPENSYIYEIVAEEEPGCHAQMPLTGDPLTAEELKLISDWIEEGAVRE
jgi:mono/diheme cytochrome c family protein